MDRAKLEEKVRELNELNQTEKMNWITEKIIKPNEYLFKHISAGYGFYNENHEDFMQDLNVKLCSSNLKFYNYSVNRQGKLEFVPFLTRIKSLAITIFRNTLNDAKNKQRDQEKDGFRVVFAEDIAEFDCLLTTQLDNNKFQIIDSTVFGQYFIIPFKIELIGFRLLGLCQTTSDIDPSTLSRYRRRLAQAFETPCFRYRFVIAVNNIYSGFFTQEFVDILKSSCKKQNDGKV